MAKFNYKGLGLDELKSMSPDEFMKLLPARQRRTLKRGQVKNNAALFDKIEDAVKELEKDQQETTIKTHLRSLVITPKMVGLTVHVHNGNTFKKVVISEPMIGHYVGEYAPTRKMVKHSSPGVGASRSSKFTPVK
ncbi:30S ribosomal protein S19 [archaeon]|nr:30S ribosomal protein S19 [archaeon]